MCFDADPVPALPPYPSAPITGTFTLANPKVVYPLSFGEIRETPGVYQEEDTGGLCIVPPMGNHPFQEYRPVFFDPSGNFLRGPNQSEHPVTYWRQVHGTVTLSF